MAYYNELLKYKGNVALKDDGGNCVLYEEIDDFCKEIKKYISEDRTLVFSFCENSIGSVCGYISFLNNSIVPVLIDRHMDVQLRNNLIKIYNPQYLYVPHDMCKEFEEFKCVFMKYGYALLKGKRESEYKIYKNLGLLLTTSGSTGSPKFVRQSYDNIQANAKQIADYLNITENDRPITTLPMNYTYGLSIINSHLLCGATILLTNSTLMEREFWNFFKNAGATTFGGVPYTYEMLKKLRFFRMDLPSLKYMTQAGGKLTPQLHKEFAEYAMANNKEFIVMYGQCEATARMAYLPAEKSLEKYGSMGIAIPGGRLELVDVNGKEITEPDVVGELVYYGPNVTLGYAECEEDLLKGDERNGRLETGDMAKRDSEGYHFIVGRKKRFLKIYGNRVNLDEIERMLKEYLDMDCACSGIDDHLYAFITEDNEELFDKTKHFLAEKTGLNAAAFKVKYVPSIPKNEAGKTLYIKLEDYYD
ncbi:MAG: AMP-binding protein [Lachnospiraceae bacterium]